MLLRPMEFSVNEHLIKSGCLCTYVVHIAKSVKKMGLTANPGVASLTPSWSHNFTEIDHEIISMAIFLPSSDLRRVVVSYMRKYVHAVLVHSLVKLAQEKSVVR